MMGINNSLAKVHVAVLLFGIAGLFGKLALPPAVIVLGRVFFGALFLAAVLRYRKVPVAVRNRSHFLYLLLSGLILAVHWVAFFQSIKVSTVAIGVLTFATFPVFVSFLEPYFFREKLKARNVGAAIAAFAGVAFIIPAGFELENHLTQGVLWGVFSGFTFALLSLLNRRMVRDYSSIVVSFYQQGTATVLLLPALLLEPAALDAEAVLMLALLGIVFTGIAHSLFISSLKNISTQTASIIASLEPLYSVICAALLLGETPSFREVAGGIIILGATFYATVKAR